MSSVQDRANLLDAVGNAILARKEELGRLLSREEGKTLPEGIGEVVRAGQIFKFFGGEALRLAGEKIQSVAARRRRRGHARAARRHRHHHAVEFSDRDSGVEDRAGALLRQLRGVQAGGAGARVRRGRSSEIIIKAGMPAGVFNLVMGRGSVVGETIINDSARRRHQLYRLGGNRPRDRGQGDRAHGQVAAGNGRKESAGRARRRRSGRGRQLRGQRRVLFRPGSAARRRRA